MIYEAKARLGENIIKTPILSSPFLDAIAGKKILIKAECLQKTGSFKYRGAWAAISALKKKCEKQWCNSILLRESCTRNSGCFKSF